MEISSIKSSAFYRYTATGSNATITGTFTTSSLPVIEVGGMYVTTNILSTVTTYTETTVTEYTSYTSSISTTETVSSYSKGQYGRESVVYATQPSDTISSWNGGTNTFSLFSYYKTIYRSETGKYTISTVGITTTMYVNGTQVEIDTGSQVKSTASGETVGNTVSLEVYDDYNLHDIKAEGYETSKWILEDMSFQSSNLVLSSGSTVTENHFTAKAFQVQLLNNFTAISRRGYGNVTTVQYRDSAAYTTTGNYGIYGENSSTITSYSGSYTQSTNYGSDEFKSSRGFTTIPSYN